MTETEPLIQLNEKKCTLCYACVRACPVKAFRLKTSDGVPEILNNRCIGCGQCITSCSYEAITYRDSKQDVKKLLKNKNKYSVIIVDPSFSG